MAEFQVYKQRWPMLFGYATCSLLNAVMWISFSSIDEAAASFYNVTIEHVNWLALVFQVAYLPGMVLTIYATEAQSLRRVVVTGAGLGAVGGLLRALSALVAPHRPALGYGLCLMGQLAGALGQPMFVCTPAVVAGHWFPVEERDLATTLGALFNPLGNALGQVVPPLVVTWTAAAATSSPSGSGDDDSGGDDDDELRAGMQRLLGGQAAALVVAFAWALACFRSHPPTPPSRSTAERIRAKEERAKAETAQQAAGQWFSAVGASGAGAAAAAGGGGGVWAGTRGHLAALLRDRHFLLLLAAFSLGLATFNAMLTVLAQWLAPYGFSNAQAGAAGGVLIVCGLVGACASGALVDAYHCYRPLLKASFALSFIALVAVCAVLSRGAGFGPFLACFGVLGFVTMPILPAAIETAVEATYPIPEEATSGVLFCFGNVCGVGMTVCLARLIALDSPRDFLCPPSALLLVTTASCALTVLPYQGQYKRLAAEPPPGTLRRPLVAVGEEEDGGISTSLAQADLHDPLGIIFRTSSREGTPSPLSEDSR